MQELWKEFPLDIRYEVSTHGRIRRADNQRIRQASIKQNGYRGLVFTYPLSEQKKCRGYDLHVIVAITWLGSRPKGLDVSHLDGNRLNNKLNNLAYESRKENSQKTFNRYGAKNSRLTEKLVRHIRKDTKHSNAYWAKKLSMKVRNIWRARNHKSWRYLK